MDDTPPNNGAPPVPEKTVIAPPPAAVPNDQAKQFASLIRKEKELLTERQKLSEERKKFETDIKESQQLKSWRDSAKKDPVSLLKGIFGDDYYSQITDLELGKGKLTPELQIAAVKDEFESWKKQQEEEKSKIAAETKTKEEQEHILAIKKFEEEVVGHVKQSGEKYELINLLGYHDHVPELIRMHYQDQLSKGVDGDQVKILTSDEAADMVEKWLEENVIKAAASKRISSKLTKTDSSANNTNNAPGGEQRETRTLTNDLSSTPGRTAPPRSEEERKRRALAAYDAVVNSRKGP